MEVTSILQLWRERAKGVEACGREQTQESPVSQVEGSQGLTES